VAETKSAAAAVAVMAVRMWFGFVVGGCGSVGVAVGSAMLNVWMLE